MSAAESDEAEGETVGGERMIINQRTGSRYHTNWLNMMYPRLRVAKDLLSEDGVIFISIDDNEADNLKKVCNEIFGEQNFEASFYLKVRHEDRILREDINYQLVIEQVLCYSKPKYSPSRRKKSRDPSLDYRYDVEIKAPPSKTVRIANYDVEIYDRASWEAVDRGAGSGALKEYQIRGSLISQSGSASEFYEMFLRDRRERDGAGALYKVIGMGAKGDGLGYRYIRQPDDFSNKNGFYFQGRPLSERRDAGLPYQNYYDFVAETNNVGYEGGVEFKNGKKPLKLLQKLFEISGISEDRNATVLDFFSGSATTAEALMRLNAEDGGARKFIMAQLPEKLPETAARSGRYETICDIGMDRIRRVGDDIIGRLTDGGRAPDRLPDVGFRVFSVGDTNIRWRCGGELPSQLDFDGGIDGLDFTPGFTDFDVVYEVLLRQNCVPLSSKIELLHGGGGRTYRFAGSFVVCLETGVTRETIERLAGIEPTPRKFILRDSAFRDDISLKDETVRRLRALIARNAENAKAAYTVEFI